MDSNNNNVNNTVKLKSNTPRQGKGQMPTTSHSASHSTHSNPNISTKNKHTPSKNKASSPSESPNSSPRHPYPMYPPNYMPPPGVQGMAPGIPPWAHAHPHMSSLPPQHQHNRNIRNTRSQMHQNPSASANYHLPPLMMPPLPHQAYTSAPPVLHSTHQSRSSHSSHTPRRRTPSLSHSSNKSSGVSSPISPSHSGSERSNHRRSISPLKSDPNMLMSTAMFPNPNQTQKSNMHVIHATAHATNSPHQKSKQKSKQKSHNQQSQGLNNLPTQEHYPKTKHISPSNPTSNSDSNPNQNSDPNSNSQQTPSDSNTNAPSLTYPHLSDTNKETINPTLDVFSALAKNDQQIPVPKLFEMLKTLVPELSLHHVLDLMKESEEVYQKAHRERKKAAKSKKAAIRERQRVEQVLQQLEEKDSQLRQKEQKLFTFEQESRTNTNNSILISGRADGTGTGVGTWSQSIGSGSDSTHTQPPSPDGLASNDPNQQPTSVNASNSSNPADPKSGLGNDYTDNVPDTSFQDELVGPSPPESWEVDYDELEFIEKIGEGGFGQVFKGKWRGKIVAIKKIRVGNISLKGMKQFRSEIAILSKVRHPNIILFLGACTQPPDICIVMEFMRGGSIYDLITSPNYEFDERTFLGLARDIAQGMNYLHLYKPKKIIHRDLKSSNLLLDENHGIVKIADFGLSRDMEGEFRQLSALRGSPHWMAPEYFKSSGMGQGSSVGTYNEAVDLFSYGIILWEIVTGEFPYQQMGLNSVQVCVQVGFHGLRPKIPPEIPHSIAFLIRQCWHQDPAKRPSFAQVLKQLDSIEKSLNLRELNTAYDALQNMEPNDIY